LPDINGYEVFKILRQDERIAKTPFILQSALASQEEALRKNISEAIKIIYKPYKQEDLLKSIEEAFVGAKET
jgi:CheY-like chemotaxis protein